MSGGGLSLPGQYLTFGDAVIADFLNWTETCRGRLNSDWEIDISENQPSENSSAKIDVYSGFVLGRLTIWESGDFNSEVLDVQTGEHVHQEQGAVYSSTEFGEKFKSFISHLK